MNSILSVISIVVINQPFLSCNVNTGGTRCESGRKHFRKNMTVLNIVSVLRFPRVDVYFGYNLDAICPKKL